MGSQDHRSHCGPLNSFTSGAFDYDFGALDNLDNPLTKSYIDLVYSTFGTPTHGQILFMNLCRYLPGRLVRYLYESGSSPALQKVKQNRDHAHRVAKELIEQKRRDMLVGQPEKDVLSLLGAFNVAALPVAKIKFIGMVTLQSKQMITRMNRRSYTMRRSSPRFGRSCSLGTKLWRKV